MLHWYDRFIINVNYSQPPNRACLYAADQIGSCSPIILCISTYTDRGLKIFSQVIHVLLRLLFLQMQHVLIPRPAVILSGLNWFIWKNNLQTSFRDWDGLGFIKTVVIKPDNKRIMRDGSMELLKLLDPPYLRPCILLLRSEYEKKTKIKEIKNISHPLKTL